MLTYSCLLSNRGTSNEPENTDVLNKMVVQEFEPFETQPNATMWNIYCNVTCGKVMFIIVIKLRFFHFLGGCIVLYMFCLFFQVNDTFTTVYSGGRDQCVWATDIRNHENRFLVCQEKAPVLKVRNYFLPIFILYL